MHEEFQKIDELLANGDFKRAEVALAKLTRTGELASTLRVPFLLRRIRIELHAGRATDALLDLDEVKRLEPALVSTPEILELTGDGYFARFQQANLGFGDRQDRDLAAQAYNAILASYPSYDNLAWVHYQLGLIRIATHDIPNAILHLQQALIQPTPRSVVTAYAYERLGFIIFYENHNPERALSYLNRAHVTYPADQDSKWLAQLHLLRSRVLRGTGKYAEALAEAQRAVTLAANSPFAAESWLMIAEINASLEKRDREVVTALAQFAQTARRPLGVDVTWAHANEMLGNAHFNLGNYDDALTAYHAVFQFNPDYPWDMSLYYRMACAHYQLHDFDNTIATAKRIIQTAQEDGQILSDYRVYDILGNAQFALKRFKQAAESYHTALEFAPPNAENLDKIRSYYQIARSQSSD